MEDNSRNNSLEARPSVIFVVYQTGNQANGGVESITQVIERIQRFKPIVITQIETPVNHRWREAGANVYVWPLAKGQDRGVLGTVRKKLRRFISLVDTNRRIYKLIRLTGCQVVHCNDIQSVWHSVYGARCAGASVIQNIRGLKPANMRYGWHWGVAMMLTNFRLALSRDMKDSLCRRLPLRKWQEYNPQKFKYVYSIVDLEKMRPLATSKRAELRSRLGIGKEEFAIGYVAACNSCKGQRKFIEIAGPLLKEVLPQSRVYFLGDFNFETNAYARSCMDAVNHLGLEDTLHLTGYTSEIHQWYQALDAVVVASENEGLARCMIESLACGTPVVSFQVCSAREILEEHECGFVVDQGDYTTLVNRLVDLAKNPTKQKAMGHTGTDTARALFSPSHVISEYEGLYDAASKRVS